MRNDSYISNLDALQDWFDLNQTGKEPKPFFTLWRGTEPQQNRLIFRNEEVGEADKSWELLSDIINSHSSGGGTFRVYLTSKPGHNLGVHTIVKIPGITPANVAGINGAQGSGTFGIYGSAKEMIEAEIERRMEVYEMRRELEDLKAGNAAMSGVEQIKAVFEAVPALNPLAQALGMKLMGIMPSHPQANPTAPGTPAPGEAIYGAEEHPGFDYDIVEPALAKMQRVFPDVEMTLDKLADWITKNPDQAKMIFGNLNQPA